MCVECTWNHGPTRVRGDLSGDRCSNGPDLNFCATRFFRHTKQKLAAAKIDGSRPFAHTKNSLLAGVLTAHFTNHHGLLTLWGAHLYSGAVTGSLDSTTRAALANYQRDDGLLVTGTVDQSTVESLGLV
jgi:peptidoglycan hydrolase-like protein with peptidoglycan-binding domain